MLALVEIGWWHWAAFIGVILVCLALDLGVFHRRDHTVRFPEALAWTCVWFVLAMVFARGLQYYRGRDEALEFVTGYLVEFSLSMDNVFVMALLFTYFRVPAPYQHRVLFWGIMGALILRGLMIGLGAALIARFHWVLYLFGAFLVFTGIKMLLASEVGVHPEKNPLLRWARRWFRLTPDFVGHQFVVRSEGGFALTPLALVLATVETTDLIFALDSIPAIFAVTQKPFIVFTSNVFAILGLRSLYFVLAGAIEYFRYLKIGLSLILVFIGVRMLLPKIIILSTGQALGVVAVILVLAMAASVVVGSLEKRARRRSGPPPPQS